MNPVTAYELRAHLDAGLLLVGQKEGELQWMGEVSQFEDAARRIRLKETHNDVYDQ
jgi:hypothetical protein